MARGGLRGRRPGERPQPLCSLKRIDLVLLPPRGFVHPQMKLAVVQPTERHGELVAHLPAERARLREPKMVSIGRTSSAYEARLRRDECPMILVPLAPRLAEGEFRAAGIWHRRVTAEQGRRAGRGLVGSRTHGQCRIDQWGWLGWLHRSRRGLTV